jgi:anti-anti-sigma factor
MSAAEDRAGQFQVVTEKVDGTATVAPMGELDIATADRLSEALDALAIGSGEKLVIDLTGVGFMDSTGLRILIGANRKANEGAYELVIVTGESPAKRVLELTRMDEHMQVVPAL